MTKVVTVRLGSEEYKELESLAKAEKRSISSMFRILFNEALEDRRLLKESETIKEAAQ